MNPLRILIVEDEALIAADLEERLSALAYTVVGLVDTGEEAVQQATALGAELVLMDIRLKGPMDGIEAARQICAVTPLPVVFLTAHTDCDTLQRAGLSEPFGYLVKPFEERALQATIEMALYRHRAETRLRVMERWLATTLQSIGDGVLATDLHGYITFLNPIAEHLTGWTRRDALGRPLAEVFQAIDADTRAPIPDLVEHVITQGMVFNLGDHTCLIPRHGGEIPIDDSAAPVHDDAGSITGVVVIFRDCSERQRLEAERRRMEEQLHDSQKLESLGVLASGIAHDFNNLLTGILGNADLCQRRLSPDSPLRNYLQQIVVSSRRAAELCAQMLAYTDQGQFSQRPLDLSTLVADTARLLQLAISKQARLQLHLAPNLPAVCGDASQLQRIVMNLVLNASEALGETPGDIRLTTGTMYASRVYLATTVTAPDLAEDEYIFLEVADTGCGMSGDTLRRIFEPFFTTKFTGRGLGLAAVLGIVRRHSGALQVDSTPGQGSTFRLLLPKAPAPMPLPATSEAASAAWHSAGTVLVVDDELLVREVTCEIVAALGFEPLAASNGCEALELCETHGSRCIAVLLDLTMPDMDGLQTLGILRQRYPALPVLLLSGYSEQEVAGRLAADRATSFMQKPFSVTQLRDKLQVLLASS